MNNLQSTFKTIHSIRRSIAYLMSRMTVEQLNKIPDGYRNNIVWNAAHIISVQQLLVNRKTKAADTEKPDIIDPYRPGTKPESDVSAEFISYVQERLIASSLQMEEDYRNDKFLEYIPYETRTKIQLDSAEDAINFELFHEGLHLGYIFCLMKHV